jgi:hypothetical protein
MTVKDSSATSSSTLLMRYAGNDALLVTRDARWNHRGMRRYLGSLGRVLLIALPCFAAGAMLMAYLAATGRFVSFETLRAGYAGEEQVAAECALHRGDAREAARHYANVVSAYDGDGWWGTNPHIRTWPLWSPFLVIARRHAGSPALLEHRLTVEALYRIRLANALGDEGRADLASAQLARAAKLYGPDGQRKVDALRATVAQMDALPLEVCSSDPAPKPR